MNRTLVPCLWIVLFWGVTIGHAQVQPPSNPYNSQSPVGQKLPGQPWEDSDAVREYSRQRTREKERQRRIVDDANRLVKLTAQYRSDVEQHGSVTPEDEKLLVQIEKLAREVKDRMRGM